MTKSASEYGSQSTVDLRNAEVGSTVTLGKIKTTIPSYPPDGTPQAGTRQPAGKSSACDAVLLGHDPGTRPSSSVKDAQEVKGAAKKAIWIQVQGDGGSNSPNGDGKLRNKNAWGVEEPRSGS
jgi:hypothetical protein